MYRIKPSALFTLTALLLIVASVVPLFGKFIGYFSFD
jgi:hypothetical protein